MRRVFAAIGAALLCASGGAAVVAPAVDQALVESDAMPPKLSAFGLFRGNDPGQPSTGIAYTLRAPLFSDYTEKHRFIAIPAGKKAKGERSQLSSFVYDKGDAAIIKRFASVQSKDMAWIMAGYIEPMVRRVLAKKWEPPTPATS